uniref:ribosomal protein S13 n=1 Tax=Ochrosphaera neapolitana TaxID=35137 RepID=UPI00286CD7C8|nr:ribosomal protein S13 [Ochrosphaera neapolitana]WKK50121.1 ribosomal protein S13 [Ochrosphaera neapolitana]
MVRISGVDLPRNKRVEIGLTYIFGIGSTSAVKILDEAGVSPDIRCNDLQDEDITRLRTIIDEKYQTEGDLRRLYSLNIKRLTEVGSAAGRRHRVNLPVRGQRTRTNARTRKGKKAVVTNKKAR